VHETLAGETIVIHLTTGIYFSITGSGSEIWNLLGARKSVPQICVELARRHDCREEDIRAQVEDFLADLEREDLIESAADLVDPSNHVAGDSPVSPDTANGAWVPPRLERFDDMRDFLLVDPIHEVDEGGPSSERAAQ
jgi:hypothetical protein